MASWMIHLRVAQGIYKQINSLCTKEFIMGNIAPDSGIPAPDGNGFIPSAEISHFRTLDSNGIKDVHYDLFIQDYFTEEQRKSYDTQTYSFYFGYLTHLMTDKLWAEEIAYTAKDRFSWLFDTDNKGFWEKVKRDWYDLDFLYLKENPKFEAYSIYENIETFKNVFLPFFTENAFEERKCFITEFYRDGVRNVEEHETYLSMEELDEFVEFAVEEIIRLCHYS